MIPARETSLWVRLRLLIAPRPLLPSPRTLTLTLIRPLGLPQSGFPPASFTCSGPTGSAVAREREGGGQVRSLQVHPGNCPGPELVALRRSVWVQSPLALPFVGGRRCAARRHGGGEEKEAR